MMDHPYQDVREWKIYFDFIQAYFRSKNIKHPIVVEIGVGDNYQKQWYKAIGFRHIGIDVDPSAHPDIVGNSYYLETVDMLKRMLSGSRINLLFIDGGHTHLGVQIDYGLYAPLTENIIVLHDVVFHKDSIGVPYLWDKLIQENRVTMDKSFITIQSWKLEGHEYQQGMGIIVKETQ